MTLCITGAGGRPIAPDDVLEVVGSGGITVVDPSELNYSSMDSARREAAREIALAFGVPPLLLGLPGDNTYANYKEANLAFWRQTVQPLTAKTARALAVWLRPWFGATLSITADGGAFAEEGA